MGCKGMSLERRSECGREVAGEEPGGGRQLGNLPSTKTFLNNETGLTTYSQTITRVLLRLFGGFNYPLRVLELGSTNDACPRPL